MPLALQLCIDSLHIFFLLEETDGLLQDLMHCCIVVSQRAKGNKRLNEESVVYRVL